LLCAIDRPSPTPGFPGHKLALISAIDFELEWIRRGGSGCGAGFLPGGRPFSYSVDA
jgi:hypothetical protein